MVREYVQIKFEGLVYLKRELKVRLISKRSFISDAEVKYLKIYVLITQNKKKNWYSSRVYVSVYIVVPNKTKYVLKALN